MSIYLMKRSKFLRDKQETELRQTTQMCDEFFEKIVYVNRPSARNSLCIHRL